MNPGPRYWGSPEGQLPLQQRSSLLGGTQVAQPNGQTGSAATRKAGFGGTVIFFTDLLEPWIVGAR